MDDWGNWIADKVAGSHTTQLLGLIIIIIYLIICYTNNKQKLTQHKLPPKNTVHKFGNIPRLYTNATPQPYGRAARRKPTDLTKGHPLVIL
jgi:dipeptide/tripeptide permease